ncbi:unnamed protein product, partial [Symbiodinium pilosum]
TLESECSWMTSSDGHVGFASAALKGLLGATELGPLPWRRVAYTLNMPRSDVHLFTLDKNMHGSAGKWSKDFIQLLIRAIFLEDAPSLLQRLGTLTHEDRHWESGTRRRSCLATRS